MAGQWGDCCAPKAQAWTEPNVRARVHSQEQGEWHEFSSENLRFLNLLEGGETLSFNTIVEGGCQDVLRRVSSQLD